MTLKPDHDLTFWYRDGVENILRAVDEASRRMADWDGSAEIRTYRLGFAAAIRCVAAAFGIEIKEEKE